jgi:putative transposase
MPPRLNSLRAERAVVAGELRGFLAEQYGTEVSADFISSVTDAVMAEVTAWQAQPLEPMYPVVFFDALRVKIREDAVVRNKAIYLALGILPDGTRDILGLWIENTEGAKFWMKVFNDVKTRGVSDILIAVTDGLKGIGEALGAVFPATTLQTCIVHLIRNSAGLKPAGRTASCWPPPCARCTRPPAQRPRPRPWTSSSAVSGVSATPPSRRPGVAPGTG